MTIEQARQTTQTIEEHNAAMRFAEAESLCMALASDPGIEQWPDLRARILTALSQSYWQRGMTKESLPPAELAWSVASVSQECSDGIKAKAVGNLATCYEILTNYPHALQCYATALSLAEQAGDDALIAGNLGNLGLVYWAIENYPKALEYLHQALAGYELLGNISGTAINAGNLAVIYSSTGEYDKALEYYTISIDLFRQLGNKTSEAAQIGNVGNVYKDVQQYSKAMEYYSQSLAINLEIGNKFGEAINLGNIGNVYAIKGYEGYNPQKAEEYLLKAIAMTEQLDAKWNLYENHKLLSGLYESTHQWEQSLVHFKSYHRLEHDVKSEAAARQAVVIEINRQAAEREKEIELAKVAGRMGGIHTSHMRDEAAGVLKSVEETIAIGEHGGLPTQVTHHKIIGKDNWGRSVDTLKLVAAARARGVDVTIDQYPYTASSTGLVALLPQWAQEGGQRELVKRLADPPTRAKIKAAVIESIKFDRGGGDPKNVYIALCASDHSLEGKNLAEITKARGRSTSFEDAAETAMDIVAKGGASAIFHAINEDDLVRILKDPLTMIASDGGVEIPKRGVPHPRSYGTFARVLNVYVREKHVLTLEDAVRKMSSLPAQRLGLNDRGLLRPGLKADVVVFDPDRVRDKATFAEPHQYAEGFSYVIVNGAVVLDDSKMTEARPGQVLLGAAARR